MAGQEAAGSIVIDERIVGQPLDGPPLGAYITERVPRWQQVRMLLVELVLEAAIGEAHGSKPANLDSREAGLSLP